MRVFPGGLHACHCFYRGYHFAPGRRASSRRPRLVRNWAARASRGTGTIYRQRTSLQQPLVSVGVLNFCYLGLRRLLVEDFPQVQAQFRKSGEGKHFIPTKHICVTIAPICQGEALD